MIKVGIIGSGSMGTGIAQVAATAGHEVLLCDNNPEALKRAKAKLAKIMDRLVEKGRVSAEESEAIQARIQYVDSFYAYGDTKLIIEAIVPPLNPPKALK